MCQSHWCLAFHYLAVNSKDPGLDTKTKYMHTTNMSPRLFDNNAGQKKGKDEMRGGPETRETGKSTKVKNDGRQSCQFESIQVRVRIDCKMAPINISIVFSVGAAARAMASLQYMPLAG